MKLNLNIEFESWDEYALFVSKMQPATDVPLPIPQIVKPVSVALEPVSKASPTPSPSVSQSIMVQGFSPSLTMIEKVEQYIRKGQAFRTIDVLGPILSNNPNTRSKANQWLQKHPQLAVSHQKLEQGKMGRGPLLYTPKKK